MSKVDDIIACPKCYGNKFESQEKVIVCQKCSEEFDIINGKPFLVTSNSDIKTQFQNILIPTVKKKTSIFKNIFPSPRIWTKSSINLIKKILKEYNPNDKENYVLNIGSGTEKLYQKLYLDYSSAIIRIGFPLDGKIDIYGDAMNFPIANNSIDLVISSSVYEHLKNPEKATLELNRILKKNGRVYTEIPFMRGFHMAPIDYQRYTYSGIEELFKRHGFKMIEKGICSGTFNALILIFIDFCISITPRGLKTAVRFVLSWILHPIKYLDRLFEKSPWNRNLACNFYYYGEKEN